ncbi:anti-sigma F factor antagonist [Clostridia bacterium]|nr:anti-sigma F factor antagonist [Clostridia bacterium]
MTVQYYKKDEALVLTLSGEIDHHSARGMMLSIGSLLDARHPLSVALDFSQVSFMDSSGIAVILNCYRRVKEMGGAVEVFGVSAQARRVLAAAGVDKIVRCTYAG